LEVADVKGIKHDESHDGDEHYTEDAKEAIGAAIPAARWFGGHHFVGHCLIQR
jgi:hypothetical protein